MKIVMAVLGFLFFSSQVLAEVDSQEGIAELLHLANSPGLKNIKCINYGFNDVQMRCYFEIDSKNFDELLKGYKFNPWIASKISNPSECGGGPEVGKKFVVDTAFNAFPPEFADGGSLTICANKEKNKIIFKYYKE